MRKHSFASSRDDTGSFRRDVNRNPAGAKLIRRFHKRALLGNEAFAKALEWHQKRVEWPKAAPHRGRHS